MHDEPRTRGKPPADSRAAAMTALAKWMRTGLFPDRLISDGDGQSLEIVYGVIRNFTALKAAIGRFCKGKTSPLPEAALLVGAWQLLFSRSVPDYAAVSATVEAAKKIHAGTPGFINAVLRNTLRSRSAILSEISAAPLPLRTSHPDEIVRRWTNAFGIENATAICEADNLTPSVYAIPLPYSDSNAAAGLLARWSDAGIDMKGEDPADNNGTLKIPHGVRVESLPGFSSGEFIIQDPATLLSLELLSPVQGETILDACAAPGGKTMQIASSVGPSGKVFAFDSSETRIVRLKENLKRTHLGSTVECAIADAATEDVRKRLNGIRPDAVLADAPCSNSGVFRRRPDARWRWSAEETARLAGLQLSILSNLSTIGSGRIVYSTCSIDPEEDEDVIARFLASGPGQNYSLSREGKLIPSEANDGAYAALLVSKTAEH